MYNQHKSRNFRKGTSNHFTYVQSTEVSKFPQRSHNHFTHVQRTEVSQFPKRNQQPFHPCTTDTSNTALSFQRVVDLIIHISSTSLSAQAYTSTHPAPTRSCPTVFLPRLTHPHIQLSPDPVQRSLCPGLLIHTSSTHQILSNGLSAQAYSSTHPAPTRSCPTVTLPRLTHPAPTRSCPTVSLPRLIHPTPTRSCPTVSSKVKGHGKLNGKNCRPDDGVRPGHVVEQEALRRQILWHHQRRNLLPHSSIPWGCCEVCWV